MEDNDTLEHTPVLDTSVHGYRDPEPLTYNDADKKDSIYNQHLRERCQDAEEHPRFARLPAGDTAFKRAFVLQELENRLSKTAENLDFFAKGLLDIIVQLHGETREVVRANRIRLKNEVQAKIRRVENSATEIETARETIKAQGKGKIQVQPMTDRDRLRLYDTQDARYMNGGREVPDGTIVVRINESHSEPL